MTSPGDPLNTLGDALNRYADTQEIMKTVAAELAPTENATRLASGLPPLENSDGPVLPES